MSDHVWRTLVLCCHEDPDSLYMELAKYARALLRVNTKLYDSICIFYHFFSIKGVKRFDTYIYATFFFQLCVARLFWMNNIVL